MQEALNIQCQWADYMDYWNQLEINENAELKCNASTEFWT